MNGLRSLLGLFVVALLVLGLTACAGMMDDGDAGEMADAAEEMAEVDEEPVAVYRVNAGAIEEYTDKEGRVWMADQVLSQDKK